VYSLCQTHRVSRRGAFVLERVHRVRGSSPRVSNNSSLSSSSNYDGQARVSRQSRQSHLLPLPGPVLRLVEDTPSHSRLRDKGELQLRSLLTESSRRHTTHRSPEVHRQRLSVCTSVTCDTCLGRRFDI
jgi:hypothetical protein